MAQGPDNLDSPRAKRQFTVAFADSPTPRRTPDTTPETSESRGTPAMSSNEALQAFMDWKTTRLIKSTSHTPSTGTRQPKYYDMHLAPPLRLERIVVLPDLPELISGVCDKYLENFDASPIPLATFPKYKEQGDERGKIRKISNEKTLQARYAEESGQWCPMVASALAFNLKSWNEDIFKFTLKASTQQAHAKADGFMHIQDQQLGPEVSRKVDLIRKHNLNHPVIWEFKSLTVGDFRRMRALTRIEGQFHWQTCNILDKHKLKCGHKDHAKGNRYSVTGRLKTSPDATCTERLLAGSKHFSADEGSPNAFRGGVDDDLEDSSDDEAECSGSDHSDDGEWEDVETVTPRHASSSIRKSKTRSNAVQKRKQPAKHKSKKSSKRRDAYAAIQQGWTQAVINDATIIVFNAGKYEIHGIRHRTRKTLYLSSVIEVETETNPAHGKLHTALYLAGYEDALDRACQLEEISRASVNDQPLLFKLAVTDTGLPNVEGIQDHWSEMQIREIMVKQLCSSSDVHINLPSDLSPIGSPEYRPLKAITDAKASVSKGEGLVFEVAKCLQGKVWAVSLTQSIATQEDMTAVPVHYSTPFVMKFAQSDQELDTLKQEYDIYRTLASEPVAPYICQAHGLFDWSHEGSMLWGLLLDCGGDTLKTLTKKERTTQAFKENMAQFEKALTALHASGYQHNNLNHDHILMNESGHVFFVSLGQCRKVDSLPSTSAITGPSPMQKEKNTLSQMIVAARKKYVD
ncbi:hypothetical protein NLJ89_g1620 [Agrocybe chaxingu]|uniref:Protein kinase domain-containing protein n=1 Tax=Agrocybe chaxingu TaxID=84603 RepID=A0A9W8MZQ3_9AGAR|nr:hypothetical protein NLJ89_g1620 [Agrocybe chaxingu]